MVTLKILKTKQSSCDIRSLNFADKWSYLFDWIELDIEAEMIFSLD